MLRRSTYAIAAAANRFVFTGTSTMPNEPVTEPPPDGARAHVPPSTPWETRRTAIREWLANYSRPLAELYVAAVTLVHDRSFPGRIVLLAHAVREIGNRLPDAVTGEKRARARAPAPPRFEREPRRQRLDYATTMDRLAASWRDAGLSTPDLAATAGNPSASGARIAVDARLLAQVAELIADHELARERPDDSAARLYTAFSSTNARRREDLRPAIDQWVKVTKWFVARAHAGKRADADHDLEELVRKFDLFETALGSMAQSFYETVAGLDAILIAPSPEHVDRIVAMLGHAEHFRYLVDKLEDPAWLDPLHKKGFFKYPRPLDEDPVRRAISFPLWPPSRYLARVAKFAEVQDLVVSIATGIETNNGRIHEDLADVALALPPTRAVSLARSAERWLRSPYQMLLPEKLGRLVRHLASGGETRASLRLAKHLLRVMGPEPSTEGTLSPLRPKARARFDLYDYDLIVHECLPELVRAAGHHAFQLFCDLLDRAITISASEQQDPLEDYSWIWRSRIDGSDNSELRDVLVSAVRDSAVQLARTGAASARTVIHALEGRKWGMFQRLALWTAAQVVEDVPEIVNARLGTRALFENRSFRYEYAKLAKRGFAVLDPTTRETLLSWIREGPDLDAYARSHQDATGRDPSAHESSEFAELWRYRQLAPIAACLPADLREHFDQLVVKYGPLEEESRREMATRIQPESPASADELCAMSSEEFAALVGSWTPEPTAFDPSREGLAHELTTAVAAAPQRFAEAAASIAAIPTPLARALMHGWRDAAFQGKEFEWERVLAFAESARAAADETSDRARTRGSIVDLVAAGLRDGSAQMPMSVRKAAWRLLSPLTDDPDPTPEREATVFTGNVRDALDIAVNSIRGRAMEAVIQYALWVRRGTEGGEPPSVPRGFGELGEVRDVLEKHLDPARDPSLAIRAVLGRWFPWIALLDRDWARVHVSTVFPASRDLEEFRDAAWDAYVTFCLPYTDVVPLLQSEYRRAIELLSKRAAAVGDLRDPSRHLAHHLMLLYWQRSAGLEPEGLLKGFFALAPDAVAGRALEFVGNSLYRMTEPLDRQDAERLQELWAHRWSIISTAPEKHTAEISSFGWWFACGKFDPHWALGELSSVLRAGGRAHPESLVAKELQRVTPRYPLQAITCLRGIVDGERDPWFIPAAKDAIRAIVAAALASSDRTAQREARALVDQLGATGYHEFKDLLDPPSPA